MCDVGRFERGGLKRKVNERVMNGDVSLFFADRVGRRVDLRGKIVTRRVFFEFFG